MGSFYVPTRYANNTDFGLLLKVMVWLLREEKKDNSNSGIVFSKSKLFYIYMLTLNLFRILY